MSQICTPSHLWFCSFLASWLYNTDFSSPSRIGAPFINFNSWFPGYTKSFYFVLRCSSHPRYISAIWGYFFVTSCCKCWALNLITRVWWWPHTRLARWWFAASWKPFIIIHLHPWCLSRYTAFPKTNPHFRQKATLTKWLSWYLHALLLLLLTALRCNGACCIACWIPASKHRFRATQYGISSKTAFRNQTWFGPGISLWIYYSWFGFYFLTRSWSHPRRFPT